MLDMYVCETCAMNVHMAVLDSQRRTILVLTYLLSSQSTVQNGFSVAIIQKKPRLRELSDLAWISVVVANED